MVRQHWNAVYRLLLSLTGCAHESEDLTQETFLRALQHIDKYQPGTNLRAWLLRIGSNLFFDERRKRKRVKMETLASEVAGSSMPPGHALETADRLCFGASRAVGDCRRLTRPGFPPARPGRPFVSRSRQPGRHDGTGCSLAYASCQGQTAGTPGRGFLMEERMDCRAARDWLLQAEHPGSWAADPTGPAGHLQDCLSCQNLVVELERLEADYRDQPLPDGWEQAREAFIASSTIPSPNRKRAWRGTRRAASAGCGRAAPGGLRRCIGGGPVILCAPREEAAPDVVERLIDWNLALAHSDEADGRHQVHGKQAPQLRSAVAEADLPADDRELAESLLATGEFIAAGQDPMDKADRFHRPGRTSSSWAQIDAATSKKMRNG